MVRSQNKLPVSSSIDLSFFARRAKKDGSCRFRGVEHNGIAFAAPRPNIGLRMEVRHDAVSADDLA